MANVIDRFANQSPIDLPSTLNVDAHSPSLIQLADEVAAEHGRVPRLVFLKSLLQLPIVASASGLVERTDAHDQLTRVALRTTRIEDAASPCSDIVNVSEFARSIEPAHAVAEFISNNHYLGYSRPDGITTVYRFGRDSLPAAAAVLSPFDYPALVPLLPEGVKHVEVLSRGLGIDGIPAGTMSSIYSAAARDARRRGVDYVVTYINSFLGFSGASFRGANFVPIGFDFVGAKYLDGNYITDRQLDTELGPDSPSRRQLLDGRITKPEMPIAPLTVMGLDLRR